MMDQNESILFTIPCSFDQSQDAGLHFNMGRTARAGFEDKEMALLLLLLLLGNGGQLYHHGVIIYFTPSTYWPI